MTRSPPRGGHERSQRNHWKERPSRWSGAIEEGDPALKAKMGVEMVIREVQVRIADAGVLRVEMDEDQGDVKDNGADDR